MLTKQNIETLVACEIVKNGLLTRESLRAYITRLAPLAAMTGQDCEALAREFEARVGVEMEDYAAS